MLGNGSVTTWGRADQSLSASRAEVANQYQLAFRGNPVIVHLGELTMVIREMTRQDSLDLLSRTGIGRLAFARANQPLVVPIFFSHHDDYLYCVSTIGQKIEWMRENPLIAVEVDEIKDPQHWESVLVTGQYEEIANTPETQELRQFAWSLLQRRKIWWEPGYVETVLGAKPRPNVPLYFRIRMERLTGHRASNE